MIGSDTAYEPKYARVKERLLRQIEDGDLTPGERIPPEPELMRLNGVSRATVRRAVADLVHAGYLRAEQGRGTFVQARRRQTRPSQLVAVCYHGSRAAVHNPHHYRIMHGVQETVGAAGYDVVTTTWDVEAEGATFGSWLDGRGVRGAVLIGEIDDSVVADLSAAGVPFVLADADVADAAVSAVTVSFVRASAAITTHLVQLGHRRFGLIVPPSRGDGMAAGLLEGFEQARRKTGNVASALPPIVAIPDVRAGHDAVATWLRQADRPTAVLCGADLFALGAYQATQARGWRTPDDLSVVGTGNLDIGQHLLPPLTTFARPAQRMGAVAGERLLSLLSGRPTGLPKVALDAQLILRESCAPPTFVGGTAQGDTASGRRTASTPAALEKGADG